MLRMRCSVMIHQPRQHISLPWRWCSAWYNLLLQFVFCKLHEVCSAPDPLLRRLHPARRLLYAMHRRCWNTTRVTLQHLHPWPSRVRRQGDRPQPLLRALRGSAVSELTHRVFHGALNTHIRIYMTCESTYLRKHVLRIYFCIYISVHSFQRKRYPCGRSLCSSRDAEREDRRMSYGLNMLTPRAKTPS